MRNYRVGDKVAVSWETLYKTSYTKELRYHLLTVEKIYNFGNTIKLSLKCDKIVNPRSKYGYFYFESQEVYPAEESIELIDTACNNIRDILNKQEDLDIKYVAITVSIDDKNYRVVINEGE